MLTHRLSLRLILMGLTLIGTFALTSPVQADIKFGFKFGNHYNHGHYKHYKHYGNHYYKRHYYPKYYRYNYYPKRYQYYYKPNRYHNNHYYNYKKSYKPYRHYNKHYSYQPSTKHHSRYYNNHAGYDAWDNLAFGHHRKALKQFGKQAESYPNAGLPKAGFALAAASAGDLNQGVWAMRRAFKYDPSSLHQLRNDARLHSTINHLIPKYQYNLKHHRRHRDEVFMLAALNYLKGDYYAAKHALDVARHNGDRSKSLKNLKRLLRKNKTTYHNYSYR